MGIQGMLGEELPDARKLGKGKTCESWEIYEWKYLLKLDPYGMDSQHYCS